VASARHSSFLACALWAVVLAGGGCSSFNRDWKAAAIAPADGLEGRWEGRWRSEASGHNDALRCLITHAGSSNYVARFHAKFRAVFRVSFGYTVPLAVEKKTNEFLFEGSADLGSLAGGRYTYTGRATTTNFFSSYDSKYDHGVFEMTRPAGR